jgi:hypothetical protein
MDHSLGCEDGRIFYQCRHGRFVLCLYKIYDRIYLLLSTVAELKALGYGLHIAAAWNMANYKNNIICSHFMIFSPISYTG